jgi:hypothetical protein
MIFKVVEKVSRKDRASEGCRALEKKQEEKARRQR